MDSVSGHISRFVEARVTHDMMRVLSTIFNLTYLPYFRLLEYGILKLANVFLSFRTHMETVE